MNQLLKNVLSLVILLTIGFCAGSIYAAPPAGNGFQAGNTGEWTVRFEAEPSVLTCVHNPSGAELYGALSFAVEKDGRWEKWSVVPARDLVRQRLALVDPQNNVNGYVTFTGSGGLLRIRAIHRPRKSYTGRLTFHAEARLGRQTFACRTRTAESHRVLQLAAGPADSGLNDSLFDIATDTALRLDGDAVTVATLPCKTATPRFSVEVTASPTEEAHAALTLEVIRDYYRSQWVPYYTPIDKVRSPSPPTGWMSWNVYFDKAGEEDNLAEARIGAKYLKPFGMEIWHIESWQDNSDELPVSKFANLTLRPNPRQFPHGMKWLADRIRELGFRPGIWTVPFGTGDKAFYEAHKSWFLHKPDGTPMRNWTGLYVLDPSQEVVRRHMEETHRIMSRDWGYEYFKIDGISGSGPHYSAHFYERPEVQAAFKNPGKSPLRLCLEALRRGIGPDRQFLSCQGFYTGPEVGLADAARIGSDIVKPNQPPHWENYLNQAAKTINQIFVNNIIFYTDPDTLLVGEAAPMNVARIATAVVGLPGQMMFAGDKLAELPPERMRLLQQCLPVCDVRPLDLFPIFEMSPVWDLKVSRPFGNWDVVSLFNWKDDTREIAFRFDELGLPADAEYLIYEFWGQSFRGRFRESFSASVPGRSNLLLSIHRVLPRPQFLSTDRHITQGAISVSDVAWDETNRVLSGNVRLVAGNAANLVFAVPEGFKPASAEAEGAEVAKPATNAKGIAIITLRRATSGTARWALRFDEAGLKAAPAR